MSKESRDEEHKITFDPEDIPMQLELIRDLAAMANSGGGKIIIGGSETNPPGLDPAIVTQLEGARVADFADKFIQPSSLDLSHSIDELADGKVLVTIQVSKSAYPIIMARQGTWRGFDSSKDKPIFQKGDIWVRHSSKTERATYEDLKIWMDNARQLERSRIMQSLTTFVNIPEGTELQVVSPSGLTVDSPYRLIESARHHRARDPDHLLSPDDLLWIFRQRDSVDLIVEDIELLIASSLRRGATLYWWLIQADDDQNLILKELFAVFDASDRDKSDAASSIVELASLYASNDELDALIERLRNSRYKHFREAAKSWPGRDKTIANLASRMGSARHEGIRLFDYSLPELENLATLVAKELSESRSAAMSRKLSDITKVLWAKTTDLGQQLIRDANPQHPLNLTGL